jgi:putative ABC transport system permease protein
MHEWLSQMTPDIFPGFNIALNVVTVIATLVGFLVIFLSMYTASWNVHAKSAFSNPWAHPSRHRRHGLRESVLMAVVGIALGIGLTYAIHAYPRQEIPTLFFEITRLHQWLMAARKGRAFVIAVPGSVESGAAYPALMRLAARSSQRSHRRAV